MESELTVMLHTTMFIIQGGSRGRGAIIYYFHYRPPKRRRQIRHTLESTTFYSKITEKLLMI